MIRRRCSFKKYAWNVVSGKSPLVINNSERDRFRSFSIIGKTEQVTTTGKNLLSNKPDVWNIGKKLSWTGSKDNPITSEVNPNHGYVEINLKPSTTYFFINNEKNKLWLNRIIEKDVNGGGLYNHALYVNESQNMAQYIFTTNTETVRVFVQVKNINSDILSPEDIENCLIMLAEGNVVTPYEPYTGGKPSPSPEYSQEIKNVGKWNEEKQKYEVQAKVTGKNLFNIEKAKMSSNWIPSTKQSGYSDFFVHVGAGKRIKISTNAKLNSGLGFVLGVSLSKETNNIGFLYHTASTFKDELTVNSEKDYIVLRCSTNTINKFIEYMPNLQVEISDVRTEYQQYKEQTITLTSDRPITKWDKLVEQDGQIGWLYKAVFDSDVRPSRMDLFPSGFKLYKDHLNGVFTYVCYNTKKEIGWQTSVCKQFKNVDGSYSLGTLWNYSDQPAMTAMYFNTNISTLEAFIKWMEENPLELVYKSRESEFIPLPQSEQDSIRSLISYSPTTIITVDGGEVDPSVEVLCAIKEMM